MFDMAFRMNGDGTQKSVADIVELFKAHEKVVFRIEGLGETEFRTIDFSEAIQEIEEFLSNKVSE